jgi:hypothetical protein
VHRQDCTGEQHGGKAQHRQGERRLSDVSDRGGGEQAEAKRGDGAQQEAHRHRGVRRKGAIGEAVQQTKNAEHRHDHDEEERHEDCHLRRHVRAQPQADETFAVHDRSLGASGASRNAEERGRRSEADHHHELGSTEVEGSRAGRMANIRRRAQVAREGSRVSTGCARMLECSA